MHNYVGYFAWVLLLTPASSQLTFQVPDSPPANASLNLTGNPVGLSFEFFTFPEYVTNVSATARCIDNLARRAGSAAPVRIGGATQDRGVYDKSLRQPIQYNVTSITDAPMNLTFGDSYFRLVNTHLKGQVTLGLNRRWNELANVIAAAKSAKSIIKNLWAIELGNEPDLYKSTDPVVAAQSHWSPTVDAQSQVNWTGAVGAAVGSPDLFQAGDWAQHPTSGWGPKTLFANEKDGILADNLRSVSQHSYPGGSVASLMNHTTIHNWIETQFKDKFALTRTEGKVPVFGETNSESGGGASIGRTYGAALWIVDYVLQSLLGGVDRLYFHQGTIGTDSCGYCWWGRSTISSAYYGAYVASELLHHATSVVALDTGSTTYGAYVIYERDVPVRAYLYNSDYYTTGTRSTQTFKLTGLRGNFKHAKRFTSSSALNTAQAGDAITWAGQRIDYGTCDVSGAKILEKVKVQDGSVSFDVQASEGLMIYL